MRIESEVFTPSVINNQTSESVVPVKEKQQPSSAILSLQDKVKENTEQKVTEEQVIKAIEKANQKFQYYNTYLEFSIHEETRQIMVKVYRDEEVIREIPPEKILDMVAQMMEWAGLLVDETV
ncbi:MAG: flagellar protein FlaG [Clostridia bacterium]|nr:flagellar protein FlaG [Clostridia bacterium]